MSAEHHYLLEKARRYCAYQERCLQEVKSKLESWAAAENTIKQVLQSLREDGFLDEERFAQAFAQGKLRQNHWGKNKIAYALREKQVPDLFIQMAINSLDDSEYLKTLKKLLTSRGLDEAKEYAAQAKLVKYAVQKGYQGSLAWKVVRKEI